MFSGVMAATRPSWLENVCSMRREPIFVRGIFLRNAGVFVRYIYVDRYFLATPFKWKKAVEPDCGFQATMPLGTRKGQDRKSHRYS
jgi:hypothetical protein